MSAIALVSASQGLSSPWREVSVLYPTAMSLLYKKTMRSNIFTINGRRNGTQHSAVFSLMTSRVRFVFDDEALEVKIGDQLDESAENVFVGGQNHWKYSSFLNWELWWPSFPILVYFKEIQTKAEGQIHFFPIIFNGNQLNDVMAERAGPSETSGPEES